MKHLAYLLYALLFFSCSKQDENQRDEQTSFPNENYGKQLLESDFLKYADSSKYDSLKYELINSFNIYDEKNNKIAHIDAEELSEFNFDFFLSTLNKILKKRGDHLNVQNAVDYETTQDILINGKKIKLYTKEELNNGVFLRSAPVNFFKEINEQLLNKKTEESFYLLYEGNDLHVLLLTATQYKIIAEKYKNEPKEIPYSPVE